MGRGFCFLKKKDNKFNYLYEAIVKNVTTKKVQSVTNRITAIVQDEKAQNIHFWTKSLRNTIVTMVFREYDIILFRSSFRYVCQYLTSYQIELTADLKCSFIFLASADVSAGAMVVFYKDQLLNYMSRGYKLVTVEKYMI